CSECVSGAGDRRASGSASGGRAVAPIFTGQFRSAGAAARTPGGRVGGSTCLFGYRIAAARGPIEGGADHRSGFIDGSDSTFLPPAAGRERGSTRTQLLAAGWAAPTHSPSERTVAGDERER